MNEKQFALEIKENLQEFKNERGNVKDYIACIAYRNIDDLKNFDLPKLFKFCKELNITADYAENIDFCKQDLDPNKKLVAFILN